jgi:periplasmic divalent cation tolerance protein
MDRTADPNVADTIQVVTTTSTREEAERIAHRLVTRRLAACVQVGGPISSTYRWQGKLETALEWTCTIKTLRSHFPQVEAAIRELHSYDVPEVLAFPVTAGSAAYLAWLASQVGPDER